MRTKTGRCDGCRISSRWHTRAATAATFSCIYVVCSHMYRKYIPRGCQFLANFSYSGAKYNGVQRQLRRVDGETETTVHETFDGTVQMAVEIGIMDLDPKPGHMFTRIGSRTDAGVSALDNYLVIRLEHPNYPEKNYTSSQMEDTINSYLFRHNHTIAVKGIRPVPQDFKYKSEDIEYREYCYRFIISDKHEYEADYQYNVPLSMRTPLVAPFDLTRIGRVILERKVDMKLFESAVMFMEGDHNFRSFECMSNALVTNKEREKDAQKVIQKIAFTSVKMSTGSAFDEYYKDKDVFEVRIRSKNFLYKQVRRMVGCALMVGSGIIDMDRMKFMLEYGHRWNWHDHYYTAPGDGLFLAKIKWKDFDILDDLPESKVIL